MMTVTNQLGNIIETTEVENLTVLSLPIFINTLDDIVINAIITRIRFDEGHDFLYMLFGKAAYITFIGCIYVFSF